MAEAVNDLKLSFENIKLHKAKEPWKPSFKLKACNETCQQTLVEKKLQRNVLSILNKMTPQKLHLLMEQLKKLDIKDEQRSKVVICLIYEKAVKEPIYCMIYVIMCRILAPIQVCIANDKVVDFQSLFVQKCLSEFENSLLEQSKFEKKLDSFSKSFDREKLKQKMWEEQYIIKQKLLGSVRLIGELYKQKMLNESTIFSHMKTLYKDQNEVLLEALCLLLRTSGKEICEESAINTTQVEEIFQQLQTVADKYMTCTRIRFMILDVIDLKENNWIPRRDEITPKTIEEIRRDAVLEENVRGHVHNVLIEIMQNNWKHKAR